MTTKPTETLFCPDVSPCPATSARTSYIRGSVFLLNSIPWISPTGMCPLISENTRTSKWGRWGPQLASTGIIPLTPPKIPSSAAGEELSHCVKQWEFALCVKERRELCDNTTFGMYLAKFFHSVLFLCISKVIHKVVQMIKIKRLSHFYFIFWKRRARTSQIFFAILS